jgi:hypothetical protein
MRKLLAVALAVGTFALAGCQTDREDRQLSGALIGGGAGAVIGGLAGGGTGALIGAGVGAAAGTVIADATRPGECGYRTRSGRIRWERC